MSGDEAKGSPFGTDRLFETAKWLRGIFGTIAAALLAAVPLSKFGELKTGSDAFEGAVTGLAIALTGTLLAIAAATYALTGGHVDVKKITRASGRRFTSTNASLKRFLAADRPDIVKEAGYADLDDWWTKFTSADPAVRSDAHTKLDILMPLLQYLAVRRRLRIAIALVFVAAGITAAGASAYAWNLTRATPPGLEASAGQPASVVIRLTPTGVARVEDARGDGCAEKALDALLLATGEDGHDVLMPGKPGCQPFRLNLTPEIGSVEQPPVGLPSP